ncbi:MAG: hypothetical protein H6P98_2709 [Candidatus Aminicenantes bacterium]|nr:hypothetical protein [Candidatus Aminicenantes bacterium]
MLKPAPKACRWKLIDSRHNRNVESWEASGREVTPSCPAAWSVKKFRLHGGKQEGVDVIAVDNGKLALTVIPTRGLGILEVKMGEIRLGWDSPVKEVVNPAFINLQGRGGLGWLEGFNEWLVRCGLESNGAAGVDEFVTNTGDRGTMALTLHGRIANTPAQEVEFSVDSEPPHRLRLRGRVDERCVFGPKLELQTELSTEPGSPALRVTDTVTNRGDLTQEFEMLYHINFGRPLLEAGAELLAPISQVRPFNGRAASGIADYSRFGAPQKGFVEQVYGMQLIGAADGRTAVMLRNRGKDKAVLLEYSRAEMPCFTLWKNTGSVNEGYVAGLEPGTNFPHHRGFERAFGRVPQLAPGGSWKGSLVVTVLDSMSAVQEAAGKIASLQNGHTIMVHEEPEKLGE